jgi:hypothetical protein
MVIRNMLDWYWWVAIGVGTYPIAVIGVAKIIKGRFK